MTFTNHFLTGSLIAKALPWPVAIPLAFASHFLLDSLPHFGFKQHSVRNRRLFYVIEFVDFSLAGILILWLLLSRHYMMVACGLIAFSPDSVWIYRYIFKDRFGRDEHVHVNRGITRFHSQIQKYERFWGLLVEIVYGSGIYWLVR